MRPVDSDVGTVLAEVDKVLRVDAPSPWLAHLELQASYDSRLPLRLLQYHALLLRRHEIPVDTTIVLLRPEADGPGLDGQFRQLGPTGARTVEFSFRVIRIWQQPVDELLGGGLGVLPLAPLAAVAPDALPDVIRRLDERFHQEAPPLDVDELWAATFLLLGLRYHAGEARELLRGVIQMRESSTYQAVLDEGRIEGRAEGESLGRVAEARRVILDLGAQKFGRPDAATQQFLERLQDLEQLERLIRRILAADSWTALLADAQPG